MSHSLPSVRDRVNQAYIRNDVDDGVDQRVQDLKGNTKLDSIISLLGGSSGVPILDTFIGTTTGASQTLITRVVAVGKTLTLKRVRLTSRKEITYQIKHGAVVIGSGRLGAGNINDDFVFSIDYLVPSSDTITIVIQSNSAGHDVDAFLETLET